MQFVTTRYLGLKSLTLFLLYITQFTYTGLLTTNSCPKVVFYSLKISKSTMYFDTFSHFLSYYKVTKKNTDLTDRVSHSFGWITGLEVVI